MLELSEIRTQTHIESGHVTPEQATELASADRWTPHVKDGLDAFGKAIFEAEAKKWSRVLAKAGSDEAFRRQLLREPSSALQPFGITAPAGAELRIVESTDDVRYLALPLPADGVMALSDRELEVLAASFAVTTSSPTLPQTWADTWKEEDE